MVLFVFADMSLFAALHEPAHTIFGSTVLPFFLISYPFLIHTASFLEGLKAALVASKDFDDGHYKVTPQYGIRAFARVYSAWAYGQTVSIFNWLRRGRLNRTLYL